ncbi:hypothetical protein F5H01DRAFT_393810 [Linnemannia elongata]|nr:hypothetical protein F5H01DRAFT_393810 [Linnemannia elongata]
MGFIYPPLLEKISMQSLDPDTSDTYYTLVVVARSRQLLSCSCPDFTRRRPLPCKHLFLAERVIHDLWLSRFIRPSVSADAIEARTDDHNDGLNDSDNANDDSDNANDDTNTDIFEQDSLRDQLALLSPQVYTQLEYERARRVKEERHRRKKQRKRDFEDKAPSHEIATNSTIPSPGTRQGDLAKTRST